MKLILIKNTLKLLRFPFSFFLMPIFLLALSQSESPDLILSVFTFIIIHLLVYPASNGYNSYIDQDETSIGGLKNPPKPTKALFYFTLLMDILAVILSLILISSLFSACIFLYILASRAYSSKQIRLKKHPVLGFLVVLVFQGAFTFFTCSIGISTKYFEFSFLNILILFACSFQIAGAYPLTQIYQHKEDFKDGVITLSYRLGYIGTFIFAIYMFLLSNIFYYLYFKEIGDLNQFVILQLFFLPIILFFSYWFIKVFKNVSEANFKNSLRMNIISSICMNSCFVLLNFINH